MFQNLAHTFSRVFVGIDFVTSDKRVMLGIITLQFVSFKSNQFQDFKWFKSRNMKLIEHNNNIKI